jgi:NTF2-related export protein 1/2
MAPLTETELVRISTAAAETFTDAYYTALSASRSTISSFYLPPSTPSTGRSLPHISYNGELLHDPAVFQTRYEKEMPWTHFEVQSVNVHVLNPTLAGQGERGMSMVVQVSGYVRLKERKEGPMRGFADSMVLVPNKEEVGGKGTGKTEHGRKWVIQTQNFRFVV